MKVTTKISASLVAALTIAGACVLTAAPAHTTEVVPENSVVGGPILVGSGPRFVAITPDGSYVYVANSSSQSVDVIATSSNSVTISIDLGARARGWGLAMTADGLRLYVTDMDNSKVYVIDTQRNTVIDADPNTDGVNPIALPRVPGAFGESDARPYGIDITPDGKRAYVALYAGYVSVINTDPASPNYNQVIGSPIAVGQNPYRVAITPDGKRAYVTNASSGSVSVINTDPASPNYNQVIGSAIDLGSGSSPIGVAITPDGKRAYVTNYGANTVSVLDTDPTSPNYNRVIDTNPALEGTNSIPVGSSPIGVAINSVGTRAYVTNNNAGTVSVLDTDPTSPSYNQVIDTNPALEGTNSIAVGNQPESVKITPNSSYAYVAISSGSPGSVSVIYLGPPIAPVTPTPSAPAPISAPAADPTPTPTPTPTATPTPIPTVSASATPTATPTASPSPSASAPAGFVQLSAAEKASAQTPVVNAPLSTSVSSAPVVTVPPGTPVAPVVSGLPVSTSLRAGVKAPTLTRAKNAFVTFGTTRSNANGRAKVPAFKPSRSGTYTIQLATADGKAFYLKVQVAAKKAVKPSSKPGSKVDGKSRG